MSASTLPPVMIRLFTSERSREASFHAVLKLDEVEAVGKAERRLQCLRRRALPPRSRGSRRGSSTRSRGGSGAPRARASSRCIAALHPPLARSENHELTDREHGDEDREDERQRRPVSESAEGERLLVDLRRKRLRGVDGPSSRDGEHLVEHPEAVDRAQRHAHGDRGREQRQRDLPEPPERRRTVDGRRLVELLRDPLEARRGTSPSRARRTARRARRRSSTAPTWVAGPGVLERLQPDGGEQRVQRPGVAEDELPDVRDGERAHHDRQEEDRAQEAAGLDRPVERQREREPDRVRRDDERDASSNVCESAPRAAGSSKISRKLPRPTQFAWRLIPSQSVNAYHVPAPSRRTGRREPRRRLEGPRPMAPSHPTAGVADERAQRAQTRSTWRGSTHTRR